MVCVAAAYTLAGCGSSAVSDDPPRLQAAYDKCTEDGPDSTLDVADDGYTLLIDTGEDGDLDGSVCVFVALETPRSVIASIDSTNAMMGVRDADDGELHYEWTYHPDNGLNLVITDSSTAERG